MTIAADMIEAKRITDTVVASLKDNPPRDGHIAFLAFTGLTATALVELRRDNPGVFTSRAQMVKWAGEMMEVAIQQAEQIMIMRQTPQN